jgi:HNH endonuclease
VPRVPELVRPPVDIPPWADLGEWARLRAYIAVTDRCWIHTGALADDGYGRFWLRSEVVGDKVVDHATRPSRWMWAAYNGPIPASHVVRHDCDLSNCCRPACLRLGDQSDNLGDAMRRDRITHPGRVGKADRRGARAAALAIRTAVLDAIGAGVTDPAELGAIVETTRAAGDPYADHGRLF